MKRAAQRIAIDYPVEVVRVPTGKRKDAATQPERKTGRPDSSD